MTCPDASHWLALAQGEDVPDRETLLGHADDCPACRASLAGAIAAEDPAPLDEPLVARALLGLETLPRRSAFWRRVAAAAAILIAAGFWNLRPTLRGRSPDPAPPQAGTAVSDPFREGLRLVGVGRSGEILLAPGAQAEVMGTRVQLKEGRIEIRTEGENLEVAWGPLRLLLAKGEVVLETPRKKKVGFLRSAEAEEAEGLSITLLSGRAELLLKGKPLKILSAGDSVLGSAEGIRTAPPLAPLGSWTVPPSPERLRDAYAALGPDGATEDYAWASRVRRASTQTSLALRLPFGKEAWEIPLGEDVLGPPGRWICIVVSRRGGWLRLEVAGRELISCPLEALERRATPALGRTMGLRVWGGDLEVEETRWRPLP